MHRANSGRRRALRWLHRGIAVGSLLFANVAGAQEPFRLWGLAPGSSIPEVMDSLNRFKNDRGKCNDLAPGDAAVQAQIQARFCVVMADLGFSQPTRIVLTIDEQSRLIYSIEYWLSLRSSADVTKALSQFTKVWGASKRGPCPNCRSWNRGRWQAVADEGTRDGEIMGVESPFVITLSDEAIAGGVRTRLLKALGVRP